MTENFNMSGVFKMSGFFKNLILRPGCLFFGLTKTIKAAWGGARSYLSGVRPYFTCLLVVVGFPVFLSACVMGKVPPIFKPADPVITTGSILPIARWDALADGKAWTKYTSDAVDQYGQGLLKSEPADAALYCKSYGTLTETNRRAFWVHLVSALSKFESNYDPSVKFDETTVDPKMITVSGEPIISRGLLQISMESANGYGCGINKAAELHDAGTNLQCAVRILNRWISRDGVISDRVEGKWRGAARYFSPFRNESKLATMRRQSAELPFCR